MTNNPKPPVPEALKERMRHIFIPMQELINQHKAAQDAVLSMLEDDELASWMPILDCLCQKVTDPKAERERRVFAINIDFNEPRVKQRFMLETGAGLHEDGLFPVAITLSSEAWGGRGRTEAGARFSKELHQNEYVSLASLSLDRSACLTRIPIERDKTNRMIPDKSAVEYYDTSEGVEIEPYLLVKVYAGWAMAQKGKLKPSGQFQNQKIDLENLKKGTQND